MVYVLLVHSDRHAALDTAPTFTESIPKISRVNEITLVLQDKQFTHVAHGDISKNRITIRDIRRLDRPLQLLEMPLIIPARLRPHARRIFNTGGRLPPKTGKAILAALAYLMPELKDRLHV